MKDADDQLGVFFEKSPEKHTAGENEEPSFREGLSRGYEQGYAEGLAKGHQLGIKSIEAKIVAGLQVLEEAAEAFSAHQTAVFEMAKPALVQLSLAAAKKVIRSQLAEPHILAEQITVYLDEYYRHFADETGEILLSVADYENLSPYLQNFSASSWPIVADSSLAPGDFVIRNRLAFIHHQLDRIIDELRGRVAEEA